MRKHPEEMPVAAMTERYIWRVQCPNARQYQGKREPTCGCQVCWEKYDAVQKRK